MTDYGLKRDDYRSRTRATPTEDTFDIVGDEQNPNVTGIFVNRATGQTGDAVIFCNIMEFDPDKIVPIEVVRDRLLARPTPSRS